MGELNSADPQLTWPGLIWADAIYLIVDAIGIIFLVIDESLGTARALLCRKG